MREVTRATLEALLADLAGRGVRPCNLYLVAGTSQLLEGWCDRVPQVELAAGPSPDARHLAAAAREAATAAEVELVWESPADVIPLPDGWEGRNRATDLDWPAGSGRFTLLHFDPYSVALRLITRGDASDYAVTLRYLEHGWLTLEGLDAVAAEVLPRFTGAAIGQDPAEFRRKYKGLRQMWRAGAVIGP
ncbi:MAG: hypothetical protein OER21_08455 [Gemmatimonadota bacterium]|nr:hypothetical protein [Gemmatimonadota bacterium]